MTEETQPKTKPIILIDITNKLIGIDKEIETAIMKGKRLTILPLDKCVIELTNATDKTKNEKTKIATITCYDLDVEETIVNPYIMVGSIEAVLYSILQQ